MNRQITAVKKAGLLVSALIFSGIVSGQQSFDYLLKAKAMISNGRADEAVELLTSAMNERKDRGLLLERAEAYLVNGKYQDAISDLNEANSLVLNSGEYGLARAYALKGDAATSLYHLELNLMSTDKRSEKEIMLDPAFGKIENRPEWRSFWKKEWYSDVEEGISEIEYYISSGKITDAEAKYSEMLRSYQGLKDVTYACALIDLYLSKYQNAIKTLTGLITSDSDNKKYLLTLARAQTLVFNFAGASLTYSKLISLEIPDAGLLLQRAECFTKTGETDKARSDVGRYLSVFPEDITALSMAGKVEVGAGNNLKAIEYFSENIRLHPNEAACYIDRGNSYLVSRSWEWASKDYSMSLDLDPENSDTWLNKGIALIGSGKKDDACHDFRISLSLGNKRASEYISRYCIK